MKISASVPDDLWEQASVEGEGPSETIQKALRALVDRRGPTSPTRSPEQEERHDRIRQRLREEAFAAFSKGYDVGLEMAERLPWGALTSLANPGPTGTGHRTRLLRAAEDDPAIGNALGRLRDVGQDLDTTTLDGVIQAMRDLWESVSGELPSAPSGSRLFFADLVRPGSVIREQDLRRRREEESHRRAAGEETDRRNRETHRPDRDEGPAS